VPTFPHFSLLPVPTRLGSTLLLVFSVAVGAVQAVFWLVKSWMKITKSKIEIDIAELQRAELLQKLATQSERRSRNPFRCGRYLEAYDEIEDIFFLLGQKRALEFCRKRVRVYFPRWILVLAVALAVVVAAAIFGLLFILIANSYPHLCAVIFRLSRSLICVLTTALIYLLVRYAQPAPGRTNEQTMVIA
jgi:hypothetical protein